MYRIHQSICAGFYKLVDRVCANFAMTCTLCSVQCLAPMRGGKEHGREGPGSQGHPLPCEAYPSDTWKGRGWLSLGPLPSKREEREEFFLRFLSLW